jgi:hypothetical protein
MTCIKGAFRPVQLFVCTGGMRILLEDASTGMQRCKVRHASNLCARATMCGRAVSPFQTGRHVQQLCVFYGCIRFLPCSASVFCVCNLAFSYQYDGVVQRNNIDFVEDYHLFPCLWMASSAVYKDGETE